jgi:hypothetical protein
MKPGGMFFDVGLNGDEIVVDKRCKFIVGVRFGFQPNAPASSRSGAEIQ